MKLNLGRRGRASGWTTVDLENADVAHDLGQFPWPFRRESVSEIYAGHILEHFDKRTGRLFLLECFRVLEGGACLRLAAPDLDIAIEGLNAGIWNAADPEVCRDLNSLLGSPPEREPDPHLRHRYLYSFESLKAALEECNFKNVVRREFEAELDHPLHRWISLYVEAVK